MVLVRVPRVVTQTVVLRKAISRKKSVIKKRVKKVLRKKIKKKSR